jgi:hypothetical protein
MCTYFQNSTEVVLGAPGVFHWQGKLALHKNLNVSEKLINSYREFTFLSYYTISIQVQ